MPTGPLINIFSFLPLPDIARLGRVDQLFRRVINSEALWHVLWKRDYDVPSYSPLMSWKEHYFTAESALMLARLRGSKQNNSLSIQHDTFRFNLVNSTLSIMQDVHCCMQFEIPNHLQIQHLAADHNCLYALSSCGEILVLNYKQKKLLSSIESAYSRQNATLKKGWEKQPLSLDAATKFVLSDNALILRYSQFHVIEVLPLNNKEKRVIFNRKATDLPDVDILKSKNIVFVLGRRGQAVCLDCCTKKSERHSPPANLSHHITDHWAIGDSALFAAISQSTLLIKFDRLTQTYNELQAFPALQAMVSINSSLLLCVHDVEVDQNGEKRSESHSSLLNLTDNSRVPIYN